MAQYLPPAVSQELVPVVWKEQWMPMKRFVLTGHSSEGRRLLRNGARPCVGAHAGPSHRPGVAGAGHGPGATGAGRGAHIRSATDPSPAVLTPTPSLPPEGEPTAPLAAGSPEATAGVALTGTLELLGVSFGAEGAFVVVNYQAPPQVAQAFWPGVPSVVDEASGTASEEVPVMPVIGPLIARPLQQGQPGYVILVHMPPMLRQGSLVTVDLAGYRFEHVPVQ
jgi:hypothetical protein